LSYEWINNLFVAFPKYHTIARLRYHGKTIAVLFVREFKNTISPTLGYGLQEYKNYYPFYTLIWKLIENSCERGIKWFDFGRSVQESGTFQFKTGWGAEPVQLNYQYYLHNKKKMPDTSQMNPKRKQFAKIWKMLPLAVANTLGPAIRKYYP